MIKAIKSIFNNFREHIVEISNNREALEPYLVCDNDKERKALFTRNRVWTFLNVVNAILMCFKETLTTEITEFLLGKNLKLTTSEAYIKRRGLISHRFFRDLSMWLVANILGSGILKMWRCGKYLCGIDGSRISLPDTPELREIYSGKDCKGHNLARVAFVTDLENRIIAAADIYPNNTEERKATMELLTSPDFPYPLLMTVFVMDRGYPSMELMNWFHYNTGGFIIRAKRDTNSAIAEFMDSDKTSDRVVLSLSSKRRDVDPEKTKPLTVRLIKRPPMEDDELGTPEKDSEPVVYITDLDESEFPDDTIVEAYKKRWHSETEIGTEKNELQIEIFSGIRDICIHQDFYSAIILYNLETIIRIYCNKKLAKHKGKYHIQVDMNCTWQHVIMLIYTIFGPPGDLTRQLTFTVKLFIKLHSIIRPGRSEPRQKRAIKINGKYITLVNYKRAL